MNLQQWHDTGEYFNYASHQIFYRIEGEGPPLLLIHGYPTACRTRFPAPTWWSDTSNWYPMRISSGWSKVGHYPQV